MEFSLPSLAVGALFSLIGWSAWRYGKLNSSARHMLLGVGLMVVGYLIPDPWVGLLVGAVLTGLLFIP